MILPRVGYHSNHMVVTFHADGSMHFSGEDIETGFSYLYPEQVRALKTLFKMKKQFTNRRIKP